MTLKPLAGRPIIEWDEAKPGRVTMGSEEADTGTGATAARRRTNRPRLRRRRVIVDARLQGRMLVAFLMQVFVIASVLVVSVFLPTVIEIHGAAEGSPELLRASHEMLALDSRLWPALLGGSVLAALLALRTSHKIAGPVFRFRRVFEALIRRENPGRVQLRRRDYLKPEAALISRLVESVVEDRARLASLEEHLDQIERAEVPPADVASVAPDEDDHGDGDAP